MSRQVRDAVPPRSAWGRVGWLQRVALAAMPAVLIGLPGAAFAQDGDAVAAPPTVIDIKVDTTPPDADELRECTPREEDAAAPAPSDELHDRRRATALLVVDGLPAGCRPVRCAHFSIVSDLRGR